MAARLSFGKVCMVTIVTVSSATVLYWLFWRRKKDEDEVDEFRKSTDLPTANSNGGKAKEAQRNIYTVEQGINALVRKLESKDIGNEELRSILETLLKTTAFTKQQVYFLECGGVSSVADKLKVEDGKIQELVLQIMNNMALNKESQKIIKNYIPHFSLLINASSDQLTLNSLQVLTNISVLEDHHDNIAQHISYEQWSNLLQHQSLTIQIQTLKILVNLSTNLNNIDILAKSELLYQISCFIEPNVREDMCLRCVTFLANILSASQRLQNISVKKLIISIPELQKNIRLLSRSELEDIRFHANRTLSLIT